MPRPAHPNGQAIVALVLLVLTTVYASQILTLGIPFENGVEPGASFLPIVLSAVMYVGATSILLGELRRDRPDVATAERSDHVRAIGVSGPAVVILATVIFAAGLTRVGYFASAGIYTFVVALYFNYEQDGRLARALLTAAMTAVAITIFGWLFFVQLFGLTLPGWSF